MSGIVFLGDSVWPQANCLDFDAIRPVLAGKKLVVNLEGPILPSPTRFWRVHNPYKKSLHSSADILDLFQDLGVVACGLANNHINDYVDSVSPTIALLSAVGIDYFGTCDRRYTEILVGERRYILIGICSRLPEPKTYRRDNKSPAILKPREALDTIASLKTAYPDAHIVCFVHWGYELMVYPEPADREWAHHAIQAGADFVIGHHPHVVQGMERVGNGYIFYSLGNFIFPQGEFGGEWFGFRNPQVLTELGVEIGANGVQFHWFKYDKEGRVLNVLAADQFDGDRYLRDLSPFVGMSHSEYRRWFASVGVHGHLTKRRTGPVYYGYFGVRYMRSLGNDAYMYLKRRLRRSLMWAGLHTPKIS